MKPTSRFLSHDECLELSKKLNTLAVGGGQSETRLDSVWRGSLRCARNKITHNGETRDNKMQIIRSILGATGTVWSNQIDDVGVEAAIRRTERILRLKNENGAIELQEHFMERSPNPKTRKLVQTFEEYVKPKIFYDETYNVDIETRLAAFEKIMEPVKKTGLLAAAYIEVSATGRGIMALPEKNHYYPFTNAEYSVTVRDPKGVGSGWAGINFNNWNRIDTIALTEIALDKCVRSRNPVACEPGRYTTILEPQAVADLLFPMIQVMDRANANRSGPFNLYPDQSKLGEKVFDERVTIGADPNDLDLGFVPFDLSLNVYHSAKWVDQGVLTNLPYYRSWAIENLGKNTGLPNSMSFRMEGGTSTIDEMIATTKRGILVTRFWNVKVIDVNSLLAGGYTRDGLWLIENGKISKPIKNFRFTESPMFALNQIEQIGPSQKVYSPNNPTIAPSLKVKDFSFTSLSDAI